MVKLELETRVVAGSRQGEKAGAVLCALIAREGKKFQRLDVVAQQ